MLVVGYPQGRCKVAARCPCRAHKIVRTWDGHRAVTPRQWGGGGPGQSDKQNSDNRFFSPQLILLKSNGLFLRKLSFFEVPDGVQHFPRGGGVQHFPGGGGGSNFFQGGGPIAYSL